MLLSASILRDYFQCSVPVATSGQVPQTHQRSDFAFFEWLARSSPRFGSIRTCDKIIARQVHHALQICLIPKLDGVETGSKRLPAFEPPNHSLQQCDAHRADTGSQNCGVESIFGFKL